MLTYQSDYSYCGLGLGIVYLGKHSHNDGITFFWGQVYDSCMIPSALIDPIQPRIWVLGRAQKASQAHDTWESLGDLSFYHLAIF